MSGAENNPSGRQRWTDERVLQLVTQYNNGASAGVVAETHGVSRNAVIGQLNRARKNGLTVRTGDPDTVRSGAPRKRKSATGSHRSMRPTSRADVRKVDVSVSDQGTPHSDLPIPAAHSGAVGDTGQTNAGLAVSSLEASASAPAPDLDASASDPGAFSPGVPLEDIGPKQCRFPLWPHKAKPGSDGYGMVCGAKISAAHPSGRNPTGRTVPAPLYCEAHRKLCSDGKPKRSTEASAARLKLPHLKPQVAR